MEIPEKRLNDLREMFTPITQKRWFDRAAIPMVLEENFTPNSVTNYTQIDTEVGVKINTYQIDNRATLPFNGKDWLVDWGNIELIEAFIPYKVTNAFYSMECFANNFIYLNPSISLDEYTQVMMYVNVNSLECPLANDKLWKVINKYFSRNESNKIKPIPPKKKRSIVFSPKCKLSQEEKLKVVQQECAKQRIGLSQEKIQLVIDNWDYLTEGKITQIKIQAKTGQDIKTVEKYCKECFTEIIKELNDIHRKVISEWRSNKKKAP